MQKTGFERGCKIWDAIFPVKTIKLLRNLMI